MSPRPRYTLVLLAALLAARGTSASADDRGYDCDHVDLDVRIDFDTRTIRAQAVHSFHTTAPIDQLLLDLVDSLQVTSVQVGAREVPFAHAGRSLRIPLDPPYGARAEGEVTIRYEGRPPRDGLMGFAFTTRNGVPGAFTVSEPSSASSWWPCKDVPDDKLTAQIALDVPDSLYAGGNGLLIADDTIGGRRRMVWREDWPIAPYLVGIACTKYDPYEEDYEAADGRVLRLLFLPYPEHRSLAEGSWGRTASMIAALENRFGPYPFAGEKYGMAEFFWAGSMENQTLTSYAEYMVDGTDQNDWEVVHELAHSWWGNKVTLASWDHMWLNEGFARYGEAVWFESIGGIEGYRDWIRQMWRPEFPGAIVPPDFLFNSTVYLKGAWILHMLRGILGEETFFAALRAYGERYAYGNADTEDLIAVFEEAAGRSLRWFFDPWIYGSGMPAYFVTWTVEPGSEIPVADPLDAPGRAGSEDTILPIATLVLTVEQIQAEDPYRMPVEIEIHDALGRYRVTVEDSLRLQTFRLPVRRTPERVVLDPDDWILKSTVGGTGIEEPAPIRIIAGSPWPSPGRPPFRIPLSPGIAGGFIEVLDVAGRRVAELPVDGRPMLIWDGCDQRGRRAPTGVYFLHVGGLGAGEAARLVVIP